MMLKGAIAFLVVAACQGFLSRPLSQKTIVGGMKNPVSSAGMEMKIDISRDPYWKITLDLEKSTGKKTSCDIATLGACVTSYKVEDYDYLYLRPDAIFDGSKPISGGIPICWPQFGPGDIQQHGFARNMNWELMGMEYGQSHSALFLLESNSETKAMWDHDFQVWYNVTLNTESLYLKMEVRNTGDAPFDFTSALHTYLRTSDVGAVAVKGPFLGAAAVDKTADPPAATEHQREDVAMIDGPTDTVFGGVHEGVALEDPGAGRRVRLENREGYRDTVVWSPFGEEGMGFRNFLCVESGNVMERVAVAPGGTWVGVLELVPERM
ncbi:unnamed protein product [Heterosigma akashiwo]